ncbi:MAG: hypothetical protein WBX25_32260 [Rhodomicrobium sp.]
MLVAFRRADPASPDTSLHLRAKQLHILSCTADHYPRGGRAYVGTVRADADTLAHVLLLGTAGICA